MLTSYLHHLLKKNALTEEEAQAAMTLILEETDLYQTAAFLSVLHYRGETSEEVVGMIRALEKKAVPLTLPGPAIDIVGTGGDLAHTVNISTGSALLAAACGLPVAKHGNRSVSSRSGSADVLEALGISIEMPPEALCQSLKTLNIAFMFAPTYHPCLKKLAMVRNGLKFPTVFNILGPLLNPAHVEYALIGVAKLDMLELVASTVVRLGHIKRALVFHGSGLDELTPLGPVIAYDVRKGGMQRLEIDPAALGFPPCSLQDLQGGDAAFNASILKEVFAGKPCAVADALVFNAGAALFVFNRASSLVEGICIAKQVLQEGKVLPLLEEWKLFSKQFPVGKAL